MSKAFTREDADASFNAPQETARSTRHSERRLTAYGARIVRERLAQLERDGGAPEGGALAADRLRALLDSSEVLDPAGAERVALGARVKVRAEGGKERVVVIVTPDEVGLVPGAISAASPLAQALIGARVGETVELEPPREADELTVVAIEWPL